VFTQSASYAGVFDHDGTTEPIERDCVSRERAGVPARFARDPDKGQTCFRVDHRHAHANVPTVLDALESASRASCDALQLFVAQAKVARFIPHDQIGRSHRDCRIGPNETEHLRRADFYALGAADASGQKGILIACTGRAQIVRRPRLRAAKRQAAADRSGQNCTSL